MLEKVRLGRVGKAAWCSALFATAAMAQIQVDPAQPVEARRTASEVAVLGLTPEQIQEQQATTAARLIVEAPAGINTIRVQAATEKLVEIMSAAGTGESPLRVGTVEPLPAVVRVTGLNRIGKVDEARAFAGGVLSRTEDGGYVWAATFGSDDAAGLRVHVQDLQLPPNAELYFYSDRGEAYGPYTDRGPSNDGDLWTPSVIGSTGTLQLRVNGPVNAEDLRNLSFRVTEIGHIVPTFYGGRPDGVVAAFCQYNASCVNNATCHNVSAVSGAKSAVAKMLWVQGQFLYTCSGGLLADTVSSTQIPYFLTANHCLSSNSSSLECFFRYQVSCGTSTCPNEWADPPTNLIAGKTLGATIKATGSAGDFSLFQLNQNPPSGSVFLGWNNAAVANSNGVGLYRISHPSGAPQAYSQHSVDTGSPTCQGWPRGQRIYSHDNTGATEGGSSGSPVLNSAGEVVGQLSGCCGFACSNTCDSNNNWTVDGALAYYWSSVSSFLDPGSGGCTPTTENCTDGVDNDCDGAVDCNDSNCSGHSSCGSSCAPVGASCSSNSDCCSNKCRGRGSNKTCR